MLLIVIYQCKHSCKNSWYNQCLQILSFLQVKTLTIIPHALSKVFNCVLLLNLAFKSYAIKTGITSLWFYLKQSLPRLSLCRQIWDIFFTSDFSTFWLGELKCNEIWFENVPDLSDLVLIWPTLGPNLATLLLTKQPLFVYQMRQTLNFLRSLFSAFWLANFLITVKPLFFAGDFFFALLLKLVFARD